MGLFNRLLGLGSEPDDGATPIPSDDFLHAKVLETGHAMGWQLAFENREEGLFIWRIELLVPPGDGSATRYPGTFAWCMKRKGNEIWLDDPVNLFLRPGSKELVEQITMAIRLLQEDFKRKWLALVGPVTLRGPSPETHSAALMTKTTIEVAKAQGLLPKKG